MTSSKVCVDCEQRFPFAEGSSSCLSAGTSLLTLGGRSLSGSSFPGSMPNKPRGVPRADDCKVINGIYWRLRAGSLWVDVFGCYGSSTTCYNRFVRWRSLGVWSRICKAVIAGNSLSNEHQFGPERIDRRSLRKHTPRHKNSMSAALRREMSKRIGARSALPLCQTPFVPRG